MDKCTQNLVNDVIKTVLENVNNAICFYRKRPTISMRLSLEETVIENMTFAKLVADKCEEGVYLLEQLQNLNSAVCHQHSVCFIQSLESLKELYSHFEDLLNEGKL
jgi:hypothetical protein